MSMPAHRCLWDLGRSIAITSVRKGGCLLEEAVQGSFRHIPGSPSLQHTEKMMLTAAAAVLPSVTPSSHTCSRSNATQRISSRFYSTWSSSTCSSSRNSSSSSHSAFRRQPSSSASPFSQPGYGTASARCLSSTQAGCADARKGQETPYIDVKSSESDSQGPTESSTVVGDSWGTTQDSPRDIAERLVESNAQLEAEAANLDSGPLADPSEDALDEEVIIGPGHDKYQTLEEMSADIKGLDEVFELLAQVPWLDEDDLQQKELKGVAMVGLLGTLQEVGFHIKPLVEKIWAGDHDDGMISHCEVARDQAAVLSILFHTRQLVEKYGPPARYLTAVEFVDPDQAPPTLISKQLQYQGSSSSEDTDRKG